MPIRRWLSRFNYKTGRGFHRSRAFRKTARATRRRSSFYSSRTRRPSRLLRRVSRHSPARLRRPPRSPDEAKKVAGTATRETTSLTASLRNLQYLKTRADALVASLPAINFPTIRVWKWEPRQEPCCLAAVDTVPWCGRDRDRVWQTCDRHPEHHIVMESKFSILDFLLRRIILICLGNALKGNQEEIMTWHMKQRPAQSPYEP
jgi:hypothetical protein